MEIQEGIYDIPDGCIAKLLPGAKKISIQKRKDRHIQSGDYRCKDCCHRVEGHCTHHTWYTSMVCDLRPKKTLPNTFYAAPYGQKSCEKFELKDN